MKAVVVHEFGAPEVMHLEEAPDPAPQSGEILVRVHAVGVNPVDTYIRSGVYARKPSLPYVPGTDAAGEVVAVGEGVQRFQVGDRVYVGAVAGKGPRPGAYAELAAVPETSAWSLPERLSYEQGAAIAVPYATAYRAIYDKANAQPGEWMLVHGASGAVGTAAVQIARAIGMTVVGTAGTDEGRQLAEQVGAHYVLDHRDPGHFDRVLELTNGRGVDVIVELLANVNLGRDLPILAMHGRVVVVGSRGTIEINPRDLMSRDGRVEGMLLANTPAAALARIHAGLGAGFANGTLTPIVGRRFPLAEAPAAHHAVIEEPAHGKIVLVR